MGYNTLVVLTGAGLLGACSGMVGSFAVLRKRALMGDALAHAALPGVCLAFVALGERHLPAMLLGALLTGLLGIALVTGLRYGTRIKEDAAIGIVLSVFYGAGIALSRSIQNTSTAGSRAGLESYILGKASGMIIGDIALIAAASLACLSLVLLLYKEFKIVAFDPGFASAQGWPSFQIDLALMAMVAVTVVIGLPAVGVVLVAALLIIPAAAARFWTDRLGTLLGLSAAMGAITGATGTLLSSRLGWAAGPSIVLSGTALFLVSLVASPKRGVLHRVRSNLDLAKATADAKLLRAIHSALEGKGFATSRIPVNAISRSGRGLDRGAQQALGRLKRAELILEDEPGTIELTEAGWQAAVDAVWNYRVWEHMVDATSGAVSRIPVLGVDPFSETLSAAELAIYESAIQAEGRDPRGRALPGMTKGAP